ncbi:HpcH/HpaI aldolase/citrate lyase family protein [Qipengyuania atrilutea]|uniref:CoA ester lyase n=1 Tax=Qipengyuania atrilutea TaxID=2744473 RepID=A0A850H5E2_9SPHN|nr:CoA ester lyase [Actirhodobacter atriluteus]NVD44345.1 CoA ester lyase [Actirhodobacter atriluteus]
MAAMRSFLFAPGDSAKKMTKAADGEADIVILDLEDAVAISAKSEARQMVAKFLETRSDRHRIWVRINPLDGKHALTDLAAVMDARPGGIMLPKANGRRDVERLDAYLSALEAKAGIDPGATKVMPLVTETAAAMFSTSDYVGAPRLAAMTWGGEDLADALGASENTDAEGAYLPLYVMARNLCLLGAKAAGVAAIETIQTDFRDTDGLKLRAERMWKAGFTGMLAIHPAQVPVINAAFTPSESEIAEARDIVDLFAANPGAGTLALNGKMVDRPHLDRARALLALTRS